MPGRRRIRPDKPEGWRAARGALQQARDGIERALTGVSRRTGEGVSDADFRTVLADVETRRQLAIDAAGTEDRSSREYKSAMQRFRRYATGDRGGRIPDDVRRSIADQAQAVNRSRRIADIRAAGRVQVTMVSDATVSSSSRDNFGPGYHGGRGEYVDADAFAEALERGDTWSIITQAYGEYWPGGEDQAITFDRFNDVDFEW